MINNHISHRSPDVAGDDQLQVLGAKHQHSFMVRRVTTSDTALLVDLLTSLSERTRYLRYMTPRPMSLELAWSEASRMAQGQTKHHLTLIALTNEAGRSEVIAVAELARDHYSPLLAEIAVVVRDNYQGQGIGSELVKRLVQHASSSGIGSVRANVLAENRRMLRLLRRLGLPQSVTTHHGETEVVVRI